MYTNPYRNFAEDGPEADRTHWEAEDMHEYVNPLVEQLAGTCRLNPGVASDAQQLLRLHPRAGTLLNAAVGAILICTMDYDETAGELKPRPPPPMFGKCATCGEPCASKRAARYHCR